MKQYGQKDAFILKLCSMLSKQRNDYLLTLPHPLQQQLQSEVDERQRIIDKLKKLASKLIDEYSTDDTSHIKLQLEKAMNRWSTLLHRSVVKVSQHSHCVVYIVSKCNPTLLLCNHKFPPPWQSLPKFTLCKQSLPTIILLVIPFQPLPYVFNFSQPALFVVKFSQPPLCIVKFSQPSSSAVKFSQLSSYDNHSILTITLDSKFMSPHHHHM